MAVRECTDAQRNAVRKHDTEKVDKVTVRLPKGTKEVILSTGMSVNEYVIRAVVEQLQRDGIIKSRYGMRLRGFAPGCQPMDGFCERTDDPEKKYWDILIYDRMLTEKECNDYELDYLGGAE